MATGLELRVLTEREEAILTFVGVTRGEMPDAPLIAVDIGGGSTEVSTWTPGQPLVVDSLPFGSSRLTAAMVDSDPPTDDELDRLFRATADVAAGLVSTTSGGEERHGHVTRAIFVGGTATNVARLGRLTRAAIAEDRKTLTILTASQVSSRYNVKPRRARQLGAGIAIVDALLDRFGLEGADVSDASLRDGAIIAAVRYGDRWPELIEELVARLALGQPAAQRVERLWFVEVATSTALGHRLNQSRRLEHREVLHDSPTGHALGLCGQLGRGESRLRADRRQAADAGSGPREPASISSKRPSCMSIVVTKWSHSNRQRPSSTTD